MSPLLFFAIIAGGMGWSVHKKKWGLAAFFIAMLAWIITMQLAIALAMHAQPFSS